MEIESSDNEKKERKERKEDQEKKERGKEGKRDDEVEKGQMTDEKKTTNETEKRREMK